MKFLPFFLAVLFSSFLHAEVHTWTNTQGKSIKATFISTDDQHIIVQKEGSEKLSKIKKEALCPEDLNYVKKISAPQPSSSKKATKKEEKKDKVVFEPKMIYEVKNVPYNIDCYIYDLPEFSLDEKYLTFVRVKSKSITNLFDIQSSKSLKIESTKGFVDTDDFTLNSEKKSLPWSQILENLSANHSLTTTGDVTEISESKNLNCKLDPNKWVKITPDGKYRADVDYNADNLVKVVETATQKTLCEAKHEKRMGCISLTPDGKYLASGDSVGVVKVTEVATGKTLCEVKHENGISGVHLTPDGKYLATGCGDNKAKVTEVNTSTKVYEIDFKQHFNLPVSLTPDGKYLTIYQGADNEAGTVLDLSTQKPFFEENDMGDFGLLQGIKLSKDNKYLVTRKLKLIDITKNKVIYQEELPSWNNIQQVLLSSDNKYLIVLSGFYQKIRIIHTKEKKDIATWDHDLKGNLAPWWINLLSLMSSGEKGYVLSSAQNGDAWVTEVNTGNTVCKVKHKEKITQASLSGKGKYLISLSKDGVAQITEVSTGKTLCEKEKISSFSPQSFTTDTKQVLFQSENGDAQLVELETSKTLLSEKNASFSALCSKGNYIALASKEGNVIVKEVKTDKILHTTLFPDPELISELSFTPNDHYLFVKTKNKNTGYASGFYLLDPASGKKIYEEKGDSEIVLRVAIVSPKGKYLAILSGPESGSCMLKVIQLKK